MVIYIAAKNAMTIAMHKNSTNNRLHAQENNSYIQCESIINLCKIALTGLVFFAVLYIVPGIVTCRNNSSVAIVIASMHINSSYRRCFPRCFMHACKIRITNFIRRPTLYS